MKEFKDKVAKGARRKSDSPARRSTQDQRPLLDRILDTPHLAHVVPQLQPEVLHRVIQRCGLEDCGELVALATPDQLARVFDLDLWRAGRPGLDEQFDADRFGVWLEMLVESGATDAAQVVSQMDAHLVTAAIAQHALVFDPASVSPAVPMDGQDVAKTDGGSCDIGGYLVVATRTDSWDAIVAVLMSLDAEHRDYFHRVMRGCRTLSNSKPEVDGLHDLLTDRKQVAFDLAFSRERRREKQGYVTPAQARAFLQMSRQLRLDHDASPPESPVARAYFRAIEWTDATDADSGPIGLLTRSDTSPTPDTYQDAIVAVVDVLLEAGVLPQQPRALLEGPRGHAPQLARIQRHMQFVRDSDSSAYSTRGRELAYLANTIVAGCSIQARPIEAHEASDVAVAVCNLGLENWPPHWLPAAADVVRLESDATTDVGSGFPPAPKAPARLADQTPPRPRRSAEAFAKAEAPCRRDGGSRIADGSAVVQAGTALPDDFLVGHDLVTVFQVGWTVLHEEVCMYAAEQLVRTLTDLRCDDRETRAGLDALRMQMATDWQSGAPWRARDALDVIAILDMPAWAALLGLIDECPVIHAGIGASRDSRTRAVSASAFEFISENRQIASVREFMRSLPETLRPT